MVSYLEAIDIDNQTLGVILLVPLFLNLKYWGQTKIRDYAYISLYFLFSFLSNMSSGRQFYDNHLTWQIYITLDLIAQVFLIMVASRAKWMDPPQWAIFFRNLTLIYALGNLLIPNDLFVGNWFVSQYFFNPYNMLVFIFVAYCFLTTHVEIKSNSNAVVSRYIWIVYSIIRLNQHAMTYFYFVLPNRGVEETSLIFFSLWVTNAFLANLSILVLHIMYPEAVLITHEQLLRALRMYDQITLLDNPIADIGINRIKSYLESIPQDLSADITAMKERAVAK